MNTNKLNYMHVLMEIIDIYVNYLIATNFLYVKAVKDLIKK